MVSIPAPHDVEDWRVSTAEAQDIRTLRVVLVDPRAERRRLVRQVLEGPGLMATVMGEADSQAATLVLLERHDVDLVILEIQMPVQEGLGTIAALRDRFSRLRIVVCSFHRDLATKARALDQGADAYLDKPVSADDLKAVLGRLFADFAPQRQSPLEGWPSSPHRWGEPASQ